MKKLHYGARTLTLLVVPMEVNVPAKQILKTVKDNETSLKDVFIAELPLAKSIFHPYAPQNPPSFCVYRRPLNVIKELADKTLHILILKSEGYKFPRNPNPHILELYCSSYFFGSLVIITNFIETPYILDSFTLNDLMLIQVYNLHVYRIYFTSYNNTYPTIELIKDDTIVDKRNIKADKYYEHNELFHMYNYKTEYCPHIT